MSVTAAMLERDFTVTGNILGRDEQGATSMGGFELSHKTFGKLLSVVAQNRFRDDIATVKEAVEALWSAKRPLVVTGRGARGAGAAWPRTGRRGRCSSSPEPG